MEGFNIQAEYCMPIFPDIERLNLAFQILGLNDGFPDVVYFSFVHHPLDSNVAQLDLVLYLSHSNFSSLHLSFPSFNLFFWVVYLSALGALLVLSLAFRFKLIPSLLALKIASDLKKPSPQLTDFGLELDSLASSSFFSLQNAFHLQELLNLCSPIILHPIKYRSCPVRGHTFHWFHGSVLIPARGGSFCDFKLILTTCLQNMWLV
jgi:hypothetical protein